MKSNDKPDRVFNTLQEAIRFFCRHLVSLAGWFQAVGADGNPFGETRFFSYSGFIISIHGVWNFVTAGHVLEELEQHLENKTIKVKNYVLADRFAPDAKSTQPIPFDYANAAKLPVVDDKAGLDFGLILLNRYYCNLLEANGVVPILEKDWKTIPDELSDKYIMLGLPQQLINSRIVNENNDSRVIGSVTPAGIIIERLQESPEQAPKTTYPRFVGRLDFGNSKSSFDDITGMSGGPIIGFNKALNRYWVVAVQSSWLPQSRITFGCLIPVFAQLVEHWMQDSKPSQIS